MSSLDDIKRRAEAGELTSDDANKLVAALEAVETALFEKAETLAATAKRLTQEVLDLAENRDVHAMGRYNAYAAEASQSVVLVRKVIAGVLG